ncbi:glycosyltransferase family A protein [Caballeronia sp. INDeC2]|uniref:glycosyltransferase family 2 protein n=1 Tax=Caballeronia sp. INDeC2 TaxID=2921747 RepID=UPI0032ECE460
MTSTRRDASVIVPVYNCEPRLEALLHSVLDQEGVDQEVIAICAGATNAGLSVLQSKAARDARIRVATQENRGVCATRNVGLTLFALRNLERAPRTDAIARPATCQCASLAWFAHRRNRPSRTDASRGHA